MMHMERGGHNLEMGGTCGKYGLYNTYRFISPALAKFFIYYTF